MTDHPVPRHRCAVTFRATALAASAARAYVEDTLESWGLTALTENVTLGA